MRLRRQTVEHPFGTLKAWIGATHFLTKTLAGVSMEMSLHVLAYNFKRLLSIMGSELMMIPAKAWKVFGSTTLLLSLQNHPNRQPILAIDACTFVDAVFTRPGSIAVVRSYFPNVCSTLETGRS